MKRLLYGYSPDLFRNESFMKMPGSELFMTQTKMFDSTHFPIDRSGVLQGPLATKNLRPLPVFRTFTKSYGDICRDRAAALLSKATAANQSIYVSYSGGIDSTTVLVSLLLVATQPQRERIVVLMTRESIAENPSFYRDHIRGRLHVQSAASFPQILGGDGFFLTGECNDQIMGAGKVSAFLLKHGSEKARKPYDRACIVDFFDAKIKNEQQTGKLISLYEAVTERAPIAIRTNFEFLWWTQFVLQWQYPLLYTLIYTAPHRARKITAQYVEERYAAFYDTEDFQLWSMNNTDGRFKDTPQSYKFPSKEFIFEYTKDAEYRDYKVKRGSRAFLTHLLDHFSYLDEDFVLSTSVSLPDLYVENNSFI